MQESFKQGVKESSEAILKLDTQGGPFATLITETVQSRVIAQQAGIAQTDLMFKQFEANLEGMSQDEKAREKLFKEVSDNGKISKEKATAFIDQQIKLREDLLRKQKEDMGFFERVVFDGQKNLDATRNAIDEMKRDREKYAEAVAKQAEKNKQEDKKYKLNQFETNNLAKKLYKKQLGENPQTNIDIRTSFRDKETANKLGYAP